MPSDQQAVKQLAALVNKRNSVHAKIQAAYDLIKKISDPSQKAIFVARCESIDTIYSQYSKLQDLIDDVNLKVETADRIDTLQSTLSCDELFYTIKGVYKTVCEKQSSKVDHTPSLPTTPKLPKLNVPVFDGCLDNWPNFISLYDSVIHKSRESDLIKFTYLRSLLKGPPLTLIENITLSEANYKTAYDAIINRYQCKRILAAHHLNKMSNFKPLVQDGIKELQLFLDVFYSNMEAFKNLSLPNPHDFIIFHWALRCLSLNMRNEFEQSLDTTDEIPTFGQLIKFIQSQCRIKELMHQDKADSKFPYSPKSRTVKTLVTTSSTVGCSSVQNRDSTAYKNIFCPVCTLSHKIYACPTFKKLNIDEKYDKLKDLKLCFGCLGAHVRSMCSSKGRCSMCKSSKHHTLLHNDSSSPVLPTTSASKLEDISAPPAVTSMYGETHDLNSVSVLLATAQALISDSKGSFQPVRLVIDSGSQVNCISSECVQRLGLRVKPRTLRVSGINDKTVSHSKGTISCILSSRVSRKFKCTTEAVVLNKICSHLPSSNLPSEIYQKFLNVNLADPCFHEKGTIDFLLGAELFPTIWQPGNTSTIGTLICVETIFGWIVLGSVPSPCRPLPEAVSLFSSAMSLDESIQRFWKQEEVKQNVIENPEDILCEEHFVKTHSRDKSGSFVVRLPFRDDSAHASLGDSRDIAMHRWLNLEKRLSKNEQFRIAYNSCLMEYRNLGHMTPATVKARYVLPHFAVIRESSCTTKLRVVFDASCQDSTGTSLNDRLLTGPKLQKDITEIISQFRLKPIALSADIKMMYRMIWVHPEDRQYQHILWRPSISEDITEFSLNTVTFGINSAPFIAQRCLLQLAKDDGKKFPLAAEAITTSCYMDDFVISVESEEQANTLKGELISLLGLANFSLRKWASNSKSVLSNITDEQLSHSLFFSDSDVGAHRVLGLEWNPKEDVFSYKFNFHGEVNNKRQILSQIASIFDPLGWISPVVFYAKCFMQKLWLSGCSWDDEIPEHLSRRWAEYASQLPLLLEIKIPRYALSNTSHSRCLVGFCDGSESGYSAVLYVRCASEDEKDVTINILKAKTRVAPLKTQSIPRLELNGALLLSQLYASMRDIIKKIDIAHTYFFTDSTVVLSWIQTSPHLLKTYVANRVVEILEHTSPSFWHHVPSQFNAADCSSRGLLPKQILNHPLWWAGPPFLKLPICLWNFQQTRIPESEVPELKSNISVLVTTSSTSEITVTSSEELVTLMSKFSSFTRLQRVFGWMYRFMKRIQNSEYNCSKFLNVFEIKQGLMICIKAVQSYYFHDDITLINGGKCCSKALRSLSPFLDENKILRVGGRLRNSSLPQDTKYPVIIPQRSHLAALLCDFYHLQTLHGGPQSVQCIIQKRYWIPSIRSLLRKRIFQCTRCYKMKCQPIYPVMADLPSARFSMQRAFKKTGVDMAGPLLIKEHTRRNSRVYKGYFCVFVCLSTKAVHLELTSALSTAAYQAALDRFVARRGLCSDIYCDNGTNFVGAANEMKNIVSFLKNSYSEIADSLAKKEIQYHFNPPSSPWFGGLWEAAIKSAKRHLSRSVEHSSLTFEEMSTLLARIEAVLNSRPLCAVSTDPHDNIDYLTPGHFLIGTSLLSPPEEDITELPLNRLSRWQYVQKSLQYFWKRWSTEYLHTLTQRKKWTTPQKALSKGDVVYVMQEPSSPLDWALGRIEEVLPGKDGTVRVAKVRTSKGVRVRPAAKLAPLPLQ